MRRILALLALGAVACEPPSGSPTPPEAWTGYDDTFFMPGVEPYVYEVNGSAFWEDIRAEDFAIVTWPQLEPVPGTPEELFGAPLGYHGAHLVRVTPTEPLEPGWYALRWSGEPLPARTGLHGLPLSDGSVVWRFDTAPVSQLYAIGFYPDGGVDPMIVPDFREPVHAVSCETPRTVIAITQGSVTCGAQCSAAGLDVPTEIICPGLDLDVPFRVVIEEGEIVAADDGAPIPPVDVMVTRQLTLPRLRPAPLVPAELCMGEACEE